LRVFEEDGMTCRDCTKYDDCTKLTHAIEDWDESEEYTNTSDMVDDIEETLPETCEMYVEK
jgi:hypothetical protein